MNKVKTLVVACLAALLLPASAFAQAGNALPNLPSELVNRQLHREGDTVRLCYNPDALLAGFDMSFATMMGEALLLDVRLIEVAPIRKGLPYDYRLPFNDDQIYVLMQQECDGFVGFTLAGGAYPEWLTISAPYLETRMLMVTAEPGVNQLSDLPFERRIGARGLSAADNKLLGYLAGLPEQRRWIRNVYYDNTQVMAALRDGTIGAALMWEPALLALTDGDPEAAGLRVIPSPFNTDPVSFGIILKSNDTFLRDSFSQAILAMQADGTIGRLFDSTFSADTATP